MSGKWGLATVQVGKSPGWEKSGWQMSSWQVPGWQVSGWQISAHRFYIPHPQILLQ